MTRRGYGTIMLKSLNNDLAALTKTGAKTAVSEDGAEKSTAERDAAYQALRGMTSASSRTTPVR